MKHYDTATTITKLEAAVLDHIALNLYQPTNGGVPDTFEDTAAIWSLQILDSKSELKVEARSLPGVCSSLTKKGLTESYPDGKESTISLTEAGFEAWQHTTRVRQGGAKDVVMDEPTAARQQHVSRQEKLSAIKTEANNWITKVNLSCASDGDHVFIALAQATRHLMDGLMDVSQHRYGVESMPPGAAIGIRPRQDERKCQGDTKCIKPVVRNGFCAEHAVLDTISDRKNW